MMLHGGNVPIRPNILAQTSEEDEQQRKRERNVLRDRTNRQRCLRRNKPQLLNTRQHQQFSPAITKSEEDEEVSKIESPKITSRKKVNVLINFDLDSSDSEEQAKGHIQKPESAGNNQIYEQNVKAKPIPKSFLLVLNSDEENNEDQEEKAAREGQNNFSSQKQYSKANQFPSKPKASQDKISCPSTNPSSHPDPKKCIFDKKPFVVDFSNQFDLNSSPESSQQAQLQTQSVVDEPVVIKLSSMIQKFKDDYYLQPIPIGHVFQCVMKRQKCQQSVKYHLYDSITLRNFMTIIKEDNYLIISKYESISSRYLYQPERKQRVIGRITSNFFGTQFSCSLENAPYNVGQTYPLPEKKQRIMTIQYQTNIFGLRGPRKMTAYIGNGPYYLPLNKIYETQQSQKMDKTIQKFKNKVPRWCQQANSYVLNFNGRAKESSIKNFVMIRDTDGQQAQPLVLFGKFGRELFNLDVQYPFNILQGLSLAISSFDRKLACQ